MYAIRSYYEVQILPDRHRIGFGFAERHAANHLDVTAVVVDKGKHFPMADDPESYNFV